MTESFSALHPDVSEFSTLVESLERDSSTLLESFQKLDGRQNESHDFTYPDGISLLSVKNDTLLSYMHHLVLLTAHRLRGFSLNESPGRDLVENLVRQRLVLEKSRPLEARLKYQIEKLFSAATDEDIRGVTHARERKEGEGSEDIAEAGQDVSLLSYRPNLSGMTAPTQNGSDADRGKRSVEDAEDDEDDSGRTGIYRPPKLAPLAYDPDAPVKKHRSKAGEHELQERRGGRNSALLADLSSGLSINPHMESSGGVGVGNATGANASSRARALQRMQDYEEDNFTRLVMSKKDAKRRKRDEADVALGGAGLTAGRGASGKIGAGVEEEFGDLLRNSGTSLGHNGKRKKAKRAEDAYETLRSNAKKRRSITSQERSNYTGNRSLTGTDVFAQDAPLKKGRFERAVKGHENRNKKHK